MRKILAVSDDDYKLEIVRPEDMPPLVEYVTDLYTVWDEATRGCTGSLEEKYERWRLALNMRWQFVVSKATAFAVLEAVVTQVKALKKTILDEPNSKLSALIQQEKQTES